ncbi:MAG: hypothetical protein ABR550_02070 [Wenzhouxiangellaceae bacterium]
MSRWVLEINDIGLSVADSDRVIVHSPGQIVCTEGSRHGGMLIGQAAAGQRRINPRASHDLFWAWLDRSPLARPVGPARSHADLAWLHLHDLVANLPGARNQQWLLSVPAEFDDDRLALLLGIGKSLDLDINGLVAASLAAAAASGSSRDCLVVDAQWHRFTVDPVCREAEHWQILAPQPFNSKGLGALMDAWARMVGQAFIDQTRLDPSHDAEIEQQLYDRLPGWLKVLEREPALVAELGVGTHCYRAELPVEHFIDEAQPFYQPVLDRIGQGTAADVVLRHRLAGLPGLAARIRQQVDGAVLEVDDHAPASSILERAEWIAGLAQGRHESRRSGSGIQYILTFPLSEFSDSPAQLPEAVALAPSHILIDGRALPIGAAGFDLVERGPRASVGWRIEHDAGQNRLVLIGGPGGALNLNGQPAVSGTALSIGDRVGLDGREWVLLRVDDDGSS